MNSLSRMIHQTQKSWWGFPLVLPFFLRLGRGCCAPCHCRSAAGAEGWWGGAGGDGGHRPPCLSGNAIRVLFSAVSLGQVVIGIRPALERRDSRGYSTASLSERNVFLAPAVLRWKVQEALTCSALDSCMHVTPRGPRVVRVALGKHQPGSSR